MLANFYKDTINILDISNNFNEIHSIKLDTEIVYGVYNMIYSPNNEILAILSDTTKKFIL